MSNCGNCRGNRNCDCFFSYVCTGVDQGLSVILDSTSAVAISTVDSAALSLTGDMDLRVKLAAADYTPGASTALIAKHIDTGGSRGYLFHILSDGRLELITSADGTATVTGTSTVATGLADASTNWVRVNFDANDGSGNRSYRFYTSIDGVNWTKLGSTVTTVGTTTVFDNTVAVTIGSTGSGTEKFIGKIYYAEIRQGPNITSAASGNSYDGDIVAVFDPSMAIVTGPNIPASVSNPNTGETWILATGWTWETEEASTCAISSGNGSSYAPVNYRPNNVPLPRPYGHIRRSTFQTIPNSSSTAIIFDVNETPFSGGMVNLSVTPTRLTAPVDGYYLVYGHFAYNNGLIELAISKNATSPITYIAKQNASTPLASSSVMTLIALAAGDYVELIARNFTGGPIDVLQVTTPFPATPSAFCYPNFWAEWVRPL